MPTWSMGKPKSQAQLMATHSPCMLDPQYPFLHQKHVYWRRVKAPAEDGKVVRPAVQPTWTPFTFVLPNRQTGSPYNKWAHGTGWTGLGSYMQYDIQKQDPQREVRNYLCTPCRFTTGNLVEDSFRNFWHIAAKTGTFATHCTGEIRTLLLKPPFE